MVGAMAHDVHHAMKETGTDQLVHAMAHEVNHAVKHDLEHAVGHALAHEVSHAVHDDGLGLGLGHMVKHAMKEVAQMIDGRNKIHLSLDRISYVGGDIVSGNVHLHCEVKSFLFFLILIFLFFSFLFRIFFFYFLSLVSEDGFLLLSLFVFCIIRFHSLPRELSAKSKGTKRPHGKNGDKNHQHKKANHLNATSTSTKNPKSSSTKISVSIPTKESFNR
jgi:hypothetical protein